MVFMHPANTAEIFYCCFFVFVFSSLSCPSSLSSLSSASSPCPPSSPSFPGLVISSCRGSTSSLPQAGGRALLGWLGASGCSACGAAHQSLRTCLCTSPRETTRTPRSPEGYLKDDECISQLDSCWVYDFCSYSFLDLEGKSSTTP